MAFKKEAKKPAKVHKPTAKPETESSYPEKKLDTAEDIHAIYVLLTKLEVKVAELAAKCEAAVQALASAPAEAAQQEDEQVEDEDRGVCNACGERMNHENSSVTPTGRVVHTSCKVKPLDEAPAKKPAKAAAPTLEALRLAVQGYVERHGREAAETLLNEAGYSKVSEVPEAERADAIEAFDA